MEFVHLQISVFLFAQFLRDFRRQDIRVVPESLDNVKQGVFTYLLASLIFFLMIK